MCDWVCPTLFSVQKEVTFLLIAQNLSLKFLIIIFLTYVAYCNVLTLTPSICH